MSLARKISEGTAAWLMYEFHCMRADVFDEKYLVKPISDIITNSFQGRIKAEYNHPILNRNRSGRGRPPQIDFVIENSKKEIGIAVESKWYGNTAIKAGDVIWDLIRLELLNKEYGTNCFFVLGGMKKRLDSFFESKLFLEPKTNGKTRPILRTKYGMRKSLRLDSPPKTRVKLISEKMTKYGELSMPATVRTGQPIFYPKNCRNADHQVYVWQVWSEEDYPRFYPSKTKIYNT